jgi:hypothetical protein
VKDPLIVECLVLPLFREVSRSLGRKRSFIPELSYREITESRFFTKMALPALPAWCDVRDSRLIGRHGAIMMVSHSQQPSTTIMWWPFETVPPFENHFLQAQIFIVSLDSFFVFFCHYSRAHIKNFGELQCPEKPMAFEFRVSKADFQIIMSRLKRNLVQTFWKNLRIHIRTIWLQFQGFKWFHKVVRVLWIIDVGARKGVTPGW